MGETIAEEFELQREQDGMMTQYQQSLLSLLPAEFAIGIEDVPPQLALRPELVKIVIAKIQGDERTEFKLPVQWTPQEAGALIYEIRGLNWQLGEDGKPIDYQDILSICEQFCKRKQPLS